MQTRFRLSKFQVLHSRTNELNGTRIFSAAVGGGVSSSLIRKTSTTCLTNRSYETRHSSTKPVKVGGMRCMDMIGQRETLSRALYRENLCRVVGAERKYKLITWGRLIRSSSWEHSRSLNSCNTPQVTSPEKLEAKPHLGASNASKDTARYLSWH